VEVLLAQPRGFCAGVERAIEIVERALEAWGAPVHVFHEIVHNGHVVGELGARGAVFVDRIDAVPVGSVLVYSAHGVSEAVRREAAARSLRVIDATCPLVTKVHLQGAQYAREGRQVIIIGHAGHDEVEGTRGSIPGATHVVGDVADVDRLELLDDVPVAYVTQTTLSVDDTREVIDALGRRFPALRGPRTADICYATQNRQNAVRALARRVDLVLVVGARNSSNTCRLREVAAQSGVRALQVESAQDIDPAWFDDGVARVGVTAGASTPEVLVAGVCERLAEFGAAAPRSLPGEVERVRFRLPPIVDADPPRYQVISNTQEGAPIAVHSVSTTRARGSTSDWYRRSNVAAK
jgi:4-hydroxy-3-methylbut-2-en-1-yl diphosphate reductase